MELPVILLMPCLDVQALQSCDEYLQMSQILMTLPIYCGSTNKRGFSVMIESIGCMDWEWNSCPFAWQGQYSRHAE
jgi:hypothetical protein